MHERVSTTTSLAFERTLVSVRLDLSISHHTPDAQHSLRHEFRSGRRHNPQNVSNLRQAMYVDTASVLTSGRRAQ